jgi:cyclophilin family peptidyl-prolyl cis-trans isomerase
LERHIVVKIVTTIILMMEDTSLLATAGSILVAQIAVEKKEKKRKTRQNHYAVHESAIANNKRYRNEEDADILNSKEQSVILSIVNQVDDFNDMDDRITDTGRSSRRIATSFMSSSATDFIQKESLMLATTSFANERGNIDMYITNRRSIDSDSFQNENDNDNFSSFHQQRPRVSMSPLLAESLSFGRQEASSSKQQQRVIEETEKVSSISPQHQVWESLIPNDDGSVSRAPVVHDSTTKITKLQPERHGDGKRILLTPNVNWMNDSFLRPTLVNFKMFVQNNFSYLKQQFIQKKNRNFFVVSFNITTLLLFLTIPFVKHTTIITTAFSDTISSHSRYGQAVVRPDHIILPSRNNENNGDDTNGESWYFRRRRIMVNEESAQSPGGVTTGIVTSEPKPLTLRDILIADDGFHLAMAPAFFGFYGYFGALDAWENALLNHSTIENKAVTSDNLLLSEKVRSVAGASAGAMAAVMLAAGVRPNVAAEFVSNIKLGDFADFPGVLAFFRGNKFERIMHNFLTHHTATGTGNGTQRESISENTTSLQLEDTMIPIAVSAFDIQTMQEYILQRGSMARAARASATFPFLFQPVGWYDTQQQNEYVLVDGGITDSTGMAGLNATIRRLDDRNSDLKKKDNSVSRVINLCIGAFGITSPLLGPSSLPGQPDVISISIQNLPQPGPWAMSLGPKATEAARKAMVASLDVQLFPREEENHYELHIDASKFWK